MLQVASQRAQELGPLRPVDDSVIAGQRTAHALTHDNLVLLYHRLGLNGADSETARLRRIEDARELVDPVHAEIGDGEGSILPLTGRQLAGAGFLDEIFGLGRELTQRLLVSVA